MSQPLLTANNYPPQIKGYRIRQYINTESQPQSNPQTLLKVIVKNQSNGIPKIRNDVICNGKHYPFVPLFNFTSEDDLKVIEQISTIVLRDENQILCEILTGKVQEVRSSQFKDLKYRFKTVFGLDLKIDPQELFLIIISDEIAKQTQMNDILDSISQTEFVSLFKRIFENCPNRVVPKILRKITKYFNSTKGRTPNSIQRLKRVLKIIKSADENPQPQEKQESQVKPQPSSQNDLQQEWIVVPKNTKKTSTKKQTIVVKQKVTEVQQKPVKKPQVLASTQKQQTEISIPTKESQTVTKKVKQTQKVKKTEKVSKKEKITKVENVIAAEKLSTPKKASDNAEINEQNWEDVDESDENQQQDLSNGKFTRNQFNAQSSDQDLKYQVHKKPKSKKGKNANIYLDPQIQTGLGRKPPHLKKQKKNAPPTNNNLTNEGKPRKPQPQQEQEQEFDRRNYKQFNNNNYNKYKNKSRENGRNNNGEQSTEKGRREFSTDNKKIDSRILLGINGASDAVWREKMRPPRYINKENNSYDKGKGQNFKENNPATKQQKAKPTVTKEQTTKKQTQKAQPTTQQPSKNLSLQKVFTFPDDLKQGKTFKFQKRNYNLFVNKLFWVNISGDQVTVQKQGKGYIRKSAVEIIDDGKGIMTDGLTINMDGLSNLEDGGTAFGNPVFEEFTPDGQWFNVTSLDVFTYV